MEIDEIILSGSKALAIESKLRGSLSIEGCPVTVADAWANAFEVDSYIPSISRSDSLDYIVVAGLALD